MADFVREMSFGSFWDIRLEAGSYDKSKLGCYRKFCDCVHKALKHQLDHWVGLKVGTMNFLISFSFFSDCTIAHEF